MPVQLPIEEAAARLRIHPATLRRRLKRGQLHGVQEQTEQGYRWLVELPDDVAGAAPTPTPEQALEREVLAREVALLKEHVQHLRTSLTAREREIAELHVTLNRVVMALPPPPQVAPASVEQALEQAPTHEEATPTQSGQEQAGRPGWWARLGAWFSSA
jgi:hypothetical protein